MKAEKAKEITKEALKQSSILIMLLGQITEAAIRGKSWISWKNEDVNPRVLERVAEELEELGYEINFQTGDYIQIEW